ncbi:hypothetical protein E3E12_03405 [Formicincola oecophyllae]|uniref:Lipoprotein n=1 Tax=Formicincola oecophyllae TaxID=2558361 RepID=A0A4Y6UAB7_9PROT|nr:hypothetical protein [Formicincola oecophyllae]QDH13406.1 hypothetical protein E3E12_03405 [Formicincola oecophyllae]
MSRPLWRLACLPTAAWACVLAAGLAGCQNRGPVETMVDTIHQIDGGPLATLRPPPPGLGKPFPDIARTPTYVPRFPSPEARVALTQKLIAERNYAHELVAASGPLPTQPKKQDNAPPADQNAHEETVDSEPTMTNAATAAAFSAPERVNGKAMPPLAQPVPPVVRYQPLTLATALPREIPQIGAPPPLPQSLPEFTVPAIVTPVRPDFDTANPHGLLVRFISETDQLNGEQAKTFSALVGTWQADNPMADPRTPAGQRGERQRGCRLVVTGYGATMEADTSLRPEQQEREMTLGLLRARLIGNKLVDMGVPASEVLLAAQAIGDGARVWCNPAMGAEMPSPALKARPEVPGMKQLPERASPQAQP